MRSSGLGRKIEGRLAATLASLVGFSVRRSTTVVLASLAVAAALLVYVARNLGVNSDIASMISSDLPYRIAEEDFRRAFPPLYQNIVVVVDAPTAEEARAAAAALATRMTEEPRFFTAAFHPSGDFFLRNGLLYMDTEDLEALADRLARVQPYLAGLAADGTLRGLASMMSRGVVASRDGEFRGPELGQMLERFSQAIAAWREGREYRISWAEVVAGEQLSAADRRQVVVVQPRIDFSRALAAEAPISRIRELHDDLGLGERVLVRVTGDLALSYEEMSLVQRQSILAGIVSFLFVSTVLVYGLRSLRLVVATMVTLLVGLAITMAFATLAIGHVNMISSAFAVTFIGLSADYGIHFCMRYREHLAAHLTSDEAFARTASDAGIGLCLCACTTALGFYAFVPTDFGGVAELGLISGTGIFITLFLSMTCLPAWMSIGGRGQTTAAPALAAASLPAGYQRFPVRYPRIVGAAAAMAAFAAVMLLPRVRFDANPLRVRDPSAESVQAFHDLLRAGSASPWDVSVMAPDSATAEAKAARLREVAEVGRVVTITDFIPSRQDEKLAILEDIGLFLPPLDKSEGAPRAPRTAEQFTALRKLRSGLEEILSLQVQSELVLPARRLLRELDFVLATEADASRAAAAVAALETSLLSTLREQLETLEMALGAKRVKREDLPSGLVERLIAVDGRVRIEISPREDLSDGQALERFVRAVVAAEPEATGGAVGVYEGARTVVGAFREALLFTVVAILALLLLIWRTLGDVILVAAPLALASLLTAASAVVLGIPFNFADIIVLPLLLGIGVDTGIHLVARWRLGDVGQGKLLGTGTTKAVVYSALTTIGSFGTLGFTTHRGLASMGQLLALGVALMMICNLVVLPALIELRERRLRLLGAKSVRWRGR